MIDENWGVGRSPRVHLPEARVLQAVVLQAVYDACQTPMASGALTHDARTALDFLFGKGMDCYCSYLGWNADWMREKVQEIFAQPAKDKDRFNNFKRATFRSNLMRWRQG